MIVKTCLLISDDPDDPVEFAEALYEVSSDTVLVSVSDFNKAIGLLELKRCTPDVVVTNTNIAAFEPDDLFRVLGGLDSSGSLKVVFYGDGAPADDPRFANRLHAELSFSKLKESLRRILSE